MPLAQEVVFQIRHWHFFRYSEREQGNSLRLTVIIQFKICGDNLAVLKYILKQAVAVFIFRHYRQPTNFMNDTETIKRKCRKIQAAISLGVLIRSIRF